MSHPTPIETNTTVTIALAATLWRQASAAGRDALNQAELGALLSHLGLVFTPGTAQTTPPVALELRISLNQTREFGLVISAGLGGLEAELVDGNFRKDRATVFAATGLTAQHAYQLACHSFEASFISAEQKRKYTDRVSEVFETFY